MSGSFNSSSASALGGGGGGGSLVGSYTISRALSANQSLSTAALTHSGLSITGLTRMGLSITKFGTVTNDCTIDMQVSLDGGTNYRFFKTFANAEIVLSTGFATRMDVDFSHVRFVLTPGTLASGSNGFNVRIYA